MSWTKVLQFAFKNWREILVIFSLSLVSLKMRMDYNALNKAYEISKQETKERVEALIAIHSEEIERREQALKDYKEKLLGIEEEYENSKDELSKEKQKKTKAYEQQFSQDKEALANEITNTFDFEYVE
jgi:uncharacterized protein (DUF342 family)|tara:strand:+ start:236 stop:619 length:384 start_codon:yes stop_codon:yes gene_type:complete